MNRKHDAYDYILGVLALVIVLSAAVMIVHLGYLVGMAVADWL